MQSKQNRMWTTKTRSDNVQMKVMKRNRAKNSQNASHTHTHIPKAGGSSVKIERLPYLLLKLRKINFFLKMSNRKTKSNSI